MPVNISHILSNKAARSFKGDIALFNKAFFRHVPFAALAALSIAFLLGLTDFVWAADATPSQTSVDATSLGDVLYNSCANTKSFAFIFQWIAYGAGAVFVVQGIHQFRLHSDNPHGNAKLSTAIVLWAGAMGLLALPGVINTVIASLGYASIGPGGQLICAGGGSTSSGSGGGLDVMLANFVSNIKAPMISLVSIIAIICGLFMVVHGLLKGSKWGFDPKGNSITSILVNILFGALLMTIGDNLSMMLATVFGSGTTMDGATSTISALNWGAAAVSPQFTNAITAALGFVQIIGVIAFVRGWLVMKKVIEGGGQATMAQGITHIVGGVVAINIGAFLKIMDTTFGTGLLN